MSSNTVTSVGDITEALPPQVFVGINRTYAAMWYCFVCLFSIMLHTIFITFLGSLVFSVHFTVAWINFAIAIHRLLYLIFPLRAGIYISVFTAKVITILIGIIFVGIVILLNTKLIGVRWIASLMNYVAMKSRSVLLFDVSGKHRCQRYHAFHDMEKKDVFVFTKSRAQSYDTGLEGCEITLQAHVRDSQPSKELKRIELPCRAKLHRASTTLDKLLRLYFIRGFE
ncbi:unnamed protein product [Haemonchus placei]|uniref:7TM_GPCR_Srx domain-containing protein n=1 Tax=Haemonchus placei TaxID=6290 RepID=A0A0N4WCU8_HAEPC|nr:unnamed protein product [Haemonchus placei]